MNEEKIQNEDPQQVTEVAQSASPAPPPPAPEAAKNEPTSPQDLNERIENDVAVDDVADKGIQKSTENAKNVVKVKKHSNGFADDDEPLNEISSTHASNVYDTDDEVIGGEFEVDEFASEECWEQQTDKAYQQRLSLFNPMDVSAALLQTDEATLKLSKLPRLAPMEDETSAERIFNLKMFSDISLDTWDSVESFDRDTKEGPTKQEDFFEKLGPVPEVQDIKSASLLEEDYQPRHYMNVGLSSRVYGKFVDPLTGDSIIEVVEEEPQKEDVQYISEEEAGEEEEEAEAGSVEFEDFDLMFPEGDDSKAHAAEEDKKELIDMFTAGAPVGKLDFDEVIIEEQQKRTESQRVAKSIEQFVEELIKHAVCVFDRKEGDELMRQTLDKKKIFYEIDRAVKEFMVERNVQTFLNRKVENYYRRKRQMRNITPERPELLAQEKEKFKEAIENLDKLLGREIYTTKKTTAKIEALFQECEDAEEMAKDARRQFNEQVKKTFKRENMPRMEAFVAKSLDQIATVAEEISKVRTVFISRQHLLGTLKAQIDEYENIGNGLRVADYETIERETQRLEKKIEEHNTDLQRYFMRFRTTIHMMAHTKIRNEMFVEYIKQQVKKLSQLDEEQVSCRHRIFVLKTQRQKIKRQITDLSFQSGLLDKPAILLDYDKTVDQIEKKRAEVDILRETLKNTEEKLSRLEAADGTATK